MARAGEIATKWLWIANFYDSVIKASSMDSDRPPGKVVIGFERCFSSAN
jgi:hypothetical protein